MRSKKKPNPILLENIRNRERWVCDDMTKINVINDIEYLYVHRTDNDRLFMMRKDSLKKVNN